MEYEEFIMVLEEFIRTDSDAVGAVIWETKVQPLLAKLVASKAYGTCRNAILKETGMMVTDIAGKNVFITAIELQALRSAKTIVAREAVRKGIAASVGWMAPPLFIAFCVFSTATDAYALGRIISPDNQRSYMEYMNRYLQYIIRTLLIKRSIFRYQAPMTYERWLNKDQNAAWWQY